MKRQVGTVVYCGRYGCILRLEDGRLGTLPPDDAGISTARKVLPFGKRQQMPVIVVERQGRRLRLASDRADATTAEADERLRRSAAAQTSLDQKIIEYLRQTAEWDPGGAAASLAEARERPRPERLLPFESRARRQYRDRPARRRKR